MNQLSGVVATRPRDHQPQNLLESNRRHLRQKSQNYPELDRQEREKKTSFFISTGDVEIWSTLDLDFSGYFQCSICILCLASERKNCQ